ncbi:globin-coupled sensor protein [Natrinema sp. 1APR25-10V2]|uniref:globin-coupled sensor protein n=1 Tax=Natrinema sp. 1APR25-10V2 TaxID=2951081 RepID=UPI002874DB1A|nr:globin-coupled sensor protein [Natrinema sp. 1APR25-10V2]MDS0476686.1 globin-coupled sensor protein [Natrinema sp. 1APR25-10V2]
MQPEQTFGHGGLNGFLDVDELVDRIGLDETEIAWRKQFIGFDEADEQRLSELEPLLRDNREEIADDFYENVLRYEGTREVIDRSPKGVDALKQTQQAYLVSLATGDYDRSYFQNRARIGKLHELLDMPLKHYVGQYGVYYDLILSRLNERVQDRVVDAIEEWAEEREAERDGGGLERFVGALGLGDEDDEADGLEESFEEAVRAAIDDGMMDVLSLLRIINLDLQVATDTYVDSYARRLEESIERRERLAREVERDVQQPITDLYDSSQVVARRAEAISDHTESQAAGVTRAASELNEVSAAVEEVASVADEVRAESDRTERLAAEGVDAADDALDELEAIEDATDRVADAVDALAERTDEIDEVVDRLDDLAERTTVLAANAKIESSRGDGGGGETMGVIASEVRSFAEQTKADLSEIESAVEAVREEAAATVETTEETVTRVDAGTDRVRETVDSLEAIHGSAEKTAAGMEDVAAAADQQARGVEVAAETLEDLSNSADQVASAAESVAAASEQQTASLREVRDSVARLTDDESDAEPPVYERVD